MEKIIEMIWGALINPSLITLGVCVVLLIFYSMHYVSHIEDYFTYRILKKYKYYSDEAVDHSLKKMIDKKKDQEIIFKIIGVRQRDLAELIMKLLTHPSLVLYQRDLDFYRPYFYLEGRSLKIKSVKCFDKIMNGISTVSFWSVLIVFAIFALSTLILILLLLLGVYLDSPNLVSTLKPIFVNLAISIVSYHMVFAIQKTLYKNNEKEMNELLDKFNNSESN